MIKTKAWVRVLSERFGFAICGWEGVSVPNFSPVSQMVWQHTQVQTITFIIKREVLKNVEKMLKISWQVDFRRFDMVTKGQLV